MRDQSVIRFPTTAVTILIIMVGLFTATLPGRQSGSEALVQALIEIGPAGHLAATTLLPATKRAR